MSSQLALYNFPDAYSTLVSTYTGTVKYISSTGSNSNNGDAVTTPYLTVDYAYTQTSATSRVMFVILEGTYTMTAVSTGNSVALRDGGNERVFVGCPGKAIIQWTASTGDRDSPMVQFTNTASAMYGIIAKRNNNGRSTNYMTAYFKGVAKGNFYNCVFSETNSGNVWSYQYDNYAENNIAIRNCTIYNAAAPAGNYTNAGTCLTIDTVFNTTCTTGGTETNVLKSQTVNSSTYETTGVTTAGVYSGTYAWNGAMTAPLSTAVVSATTGSPTTSIFSDGLTSYKYYAFTSSGSITFSTGGTVDILTVAGGGGGGGGTLGGGGGAGGLLVTSTNVTGGSTTNLVADATYNSQGWVSASTDYTGSTRAYSFSATLQSSSGGARTIALPEVDSYFEVLISGGNFETLCGLARDSHTGGYSNTPSIYLFSGSGYGGVTGGTNFSAFVANDVLQIAYKASTNKIFFGKNNTWYTSPTATAGFSIPGTGSLRFIIMAGSSAGSTMSGTFRSPAQNSYTAPSGYSTLNPATYTITVGAGGASTTNVGNNGSNTVVSGTGVSIISVGGGAGGTYGATSTVGQNGGSGGGGTYYPNTAGGVGVYTGSTYLNQTRQGYNGGVGRNFSSGAGTGGGGGAGAIGGDAGANDPGPSGAGGVGLRLNYNGSNVYYAGGGGGGGYGAGGDIGGAGGSGGGAAGSGVVMGTSDTTRGATAPTSGVGGTAGVNTGGGGGGAAGTGGAGGSGIVIIRYTIQPVGLSASANTAVSGANITFSLYSANTGNIPYTITGITSDVINNAALTGNFVMSSGSGTATFTVKSLLTSSYTMNMSADGSNVSVTLSPNVSISTAIIEVSGSNVSAYLENPVPGQMEIPKSVTTELNYSVSSTPLVTMVDKANAVSLSYTTMTNSIAGPIEAGVIKVFGDIPQREYWM